MLVALVPAAAALLPPLAPFHGPSAAARCGATPLPISMLLRPPDALGIQRKLRLQLLQRRIGSSSDGEQAGPQHDEVEEEEEDEEPFDPKMQYYIELKVQDVLDERERDALAAAREVKWTNFRLGQADGDTVGQALLAGAAVRCEGSFGDGLGNLLSLNLADNDLRDDGLIALCLSGALNGKAVMVSLKDLFLRIGSHPVSA